MGDFEKDCKKRVGFFFPPELSAELGAEGNLMSWYFNNFYLTGRASKEELGVLLIKEQDSLMSEKKGIFDYFRDHTASLPLCLVTIMEWSCFCLVLP